VITVRADGSTFVGGNWIPEEHLQEVLQEIAPWKQAAVVSADSRLRFRAVTSVLAAASSAGFSKLYLEVQGDPLRAWFRPSPAIR
jgi:biopolymer transport protein ExbD